MGATGRACTTDGGRPRGRAELTAVARRLEGYGSERPVALVAAAVALGVASGAAAMYAEQLVPLPWVAALLLPASLVLLGVVAWLGPAFSVGMLGALTFSGWNPTVASSGSLEVRFADLFLAIAAVQVIPLALEKKRARVRQIPVGWAVGAFMFIIGASVWHVALTDPDTVGASIAAWLRLVATASLVWILPLALRSWQTAVMLFQVLLAGGLVGIVLAVLQAGPEGFNLSARFSGLLSLSSMGFVAGSCVVLAGFSGVFRFPVTVAVVAVGLIGLIASKSVAALIATTFAVTLGWLMTTRRRAPVRLGRVAAAAMVGGLVLVVALVLLRPNALPTSEGFRQSSVTHRLIIGATQVQVFLENPAFGVGWQRSTLLEVTGTPTIAAAVRRRFRDASPTFYPDVAPTSTHNAYLQILAEVGIVGLVALLALALTVVVAVRRMLADLRGGKAGRLALALGLALAFAAVWWQGSAIFGGQPEGVGTALYLGSLVALWRNTPIGVAE